MRFRSIFLATSVLAAAVLCFADPGAIDSAWASMVTNGDFEATPFDDGWTRTGTVGSAETTGPISGTTSMRLGWNTSGNVIQDVSGGATDFTFDFLFKQLGNTEGRTMNAKLFAAGPAVNARVLVKLEDGVDDILQAYDGSAWQNISPDGFFSSTTEPYRVQLVGHDWGTPAATYDLLWSDAGSTALTNQSLGLTHFSASSAPGNGLSQIRFSKQYATGNSWLADDVVLDGSVFTLANYKFAGGATASIDTEPVVTATDYDASNIGAVSSSSGTAYIGSNLTGATESDAISGQDYHSFTLQMNGAAADLDVLAYDYQVTESYGGIDWTSFVRSSADGFSTNLISHTLAGIGNGVDTAKVRVVADLSGAALQSAIDDVEFRIYFRDGSTASTRRHRVSNVAATGAVRQDVLAAYSFPGNSPVSSDIEPLSLAMDYTPNVGGLSSMFNNAFARASEVTSVDAADAVANDSYHSITVSPTAGTGLDLDSLVYDYFVDDPDTTVSFSTFLRSSVDDFTTTLADHTFSGLGGSITPTVQLEADLSDAMWDMLTEDVEFRIYFYDTSSGSTRIHRIDNVVLYGAAVVPEPGTLLLSLLGLASLVLLRRFRRKPSRPG